MPPTAASRGASGAPIALLSEVSASAAPTPRLCPLRLRGAVRLPPPALCEPGRRLRSAVPALPVSRYVQGITLPRLPEERGTERPAPPRSAGPPVQRAPGTTTTSSGSTPRRGEPPWRGEWGLEGEVGLEKPIVSAGVGRAVPRSADPVVAALPAGPRGRPAPPPPSALGSAAGGVGQRWGGLRCRPSGPRRRHTPEPPLRLPRGPNAPPAAVI